MVFSVPVQKVRQTASLPLFFSAQKGSHPGGGQGRLTVLVNHRGQLCRGGRLQPFPRRDPSLKTARTLNRRPESGELGDGW